jgi:putative MFS transporter
VTGRGNRWRELLSPVYRGRTLIVWTLWASAFFIANGLNNWMPTLYREVYGLDLRDALRAASMTNVAQVVMLILCAFTIDRVGRRNWTVGSFIVGALLLGTLAVGGTKDLTLVMLLATLAYGVIGSINAVLYLYTPEVYPTRMRAIGTGLATSWLRLASAAGPPLVGLLLSRQGIDAVFVMFTCVALIGAAAAVSMIETRSRQLEEIAP